MYKRLNIGAFNWPRSADEAVEISQEEYERLMQGFEVIAKRPITEMKHPQRSDILHFSGQKISDLFQYCGQPVRRIDHYLSEQELEDEFGENGWKQLPDMISRQYCFVPAKVEIEEHHIGVYADKKDEHMVRAPHPKALLHGSLVSPSLGAAVMNGKYVNAVPLYRLEKEFERYGLATSRK